MARDGDVRFDDKFAAARSEIERAAAELVRETAHGVERDVKAAMAGPHHGATTTRGRKTHTASAAGEAPAVDTGTLINSVTTENDDGGGVFSTTVGTAIEYAGLLEGGTATIEPRPSFAPAGERAESAFQRNARKI